MLSTYEDNFRKLSKDVELSRSEVERLYYLWAAECERLKRLERSRGEAFDALVAKSVAA